MKARLNQSRFAILGMLTLYPMSGYDLRQQSRTSIGLFWREGYGQIYPTLKELEAEGLATSTTEVQAGKPDRTVYSITTEGRTSLAEWLERPAGDDVPRNETLLKLFFGRPSSPATNQLHVENHRVIHKQGLALYEQKEKFLRKQYANHPDLPYWLITLNYGRHCSEAMLEWCDQTIVALHRLELANDSVRKTSARKVSAKKVNNKTKKR